MSYNITGVKVVKSNLEITKENLLSIIKDYGTIETPEYSFVEDFNEDKISNDPDDSIYEIDKLSWIGTNSGNTIDILYNYIQKYMRGKAEFLVIWEGGDSIQKVVVTDDGKKCSCKITQL